MFTFRFFGTRKWRSPIRQGSSLKRVRPTEVADLKYKNPSSLLPQPPLHHPSNTLTPLLIAFAYLGYRAAACASLNTAPIATISYFR